MTDSEKIYAVLTGDVVASSQYEPSELMKIMERLRQGSEDFSAAFPGVVCGKLAVFSGDGWQMLLTDWRKALRAAAFMRAVVKADEKLKVDTRIAIGLGRVDQATLNLDKISELTGEAFERSGRALKEMKKPFLMTWAMPGEESETEALPDRLLAGSFQLLNEMISRWKPGQAQSVRLALLGKQQEQIAKELQVSQPVVSKSLNNAGWRGVEGFLAKAEI